MSATQENNMSQFLTFCQAKGYLDNMSQGFVLSLDDAEIDGTDVSALRSFTSSGVNEIERTDSKIQYLRTVLGMKSDQFYDLGFVPRQAKSIYKMRTNAVNFLEVVQEFKTTRRGGNRKFSVQLDRLPEKYRSGKSVVSIQRLSRPLVDFILANPGLMSNFMGQAVSAFNASLAKDGDK